ncbi:MAG: low molecular weight phosphotyrosine protein phosphatase [Bacteriovoracales bacterium]|nr:low molecular weight phosphotyrosine protein phosphatase [Bacteriovoracales bacterium]
MKRLLFVCLGNICRSPAAHAIMEKGVKDRGLDHRFFIDSAGTSGWHQGKLPDSRMRAHGLKRGFELTSLSRPFVPEDFEKFDHIYCMDRSNLQNVLALTRDETQKSKVRLMCEYAKNFPDEEVPDPYHGSDDGFKYVFDLLEEACEELLKELTSEGPSSK